MNSTDRTDAGGDFPTRAPGWRVTAAAARGFGHLVGIASLACLLALPTMNLETLELFVGAWHDGGFAPSWSGLAIHAALSALAWLLVVAGFRLIRGRYRRASERERFQRTRRGNVMVETLIVIVPFLLLTSGIAQLALRNVAGVLADLALYQGTRAAWVWQPEYDRDRGPNNDPIDQNDICQRVRLASAAVLAPTAPSSFSFEGTVPQAVQDLRATMYATFAGRADRTAGSNLHGDAENAAAVSSSDGADGENLSFARAFDDSSFRTRAARKLTFTYLALENYQIRFGDDRTHVSFVYNFNVVFPWFAQIFGGDFDTSGPSGNSIRPGWYVDIERPRAERPNEYDLHKAIGSPPDLSGTWNCDGP